MTAPLRTAGRAFGRDERGVTAIEFGLLALPFFTVIFAIMQTAIMFLGIQVLDSAVEDASRLVKTGQAQNANYTMTEFRSLVCDYTFNLFDCSQIQLKVAVISSFSSVTTNPTVQTCDVTSCTWSFTQDFQGGSGRDVIQVSAYYRWPLLVTLPYFNLRNQPDNYRLISAIRVFRNEPFS